MSTCEWNAEAGRPAWSHERGHAPATVNIPGYEGGIHVCAACAALPVFRRFRTRRALCAAEPDPKPRGRPPRDPEAGRARQAVNVRLTDDEVARFGRAALAAGYVRNDGSPAVGAWLRALGDAATK